MFFHQRGGVFLKRITGYVLRNKWFYVGALVAMLVAIGLDMFDPILRQKIVDDVIMGGDRSILTWILLGFLGITTGRAVLGYAKEILFDMASSNIVRQMRQDLFRHIQKLSFSYFDRTNTGELMSRIKEDVDNVQAATAYGMMLFVEQVIYFVVAAAMMFRLNWKMTLICLVLMPLLGYIAMKFEKAIGETYGKISDQRAKMNTIAQENIAGVRLVKAFGRERHEVRKFMDANRRNYELNVEQGMVLGKYHPLVELLSNLSIVLVVIFGGWLTIAGDMSVGTYVAFGTYIYMLIWPMRMMGWLISVLSQCKASLVKIEEIYAEKPEITQPENAYSPEVFRGEVEFRNVTFAYGSVKVLENISFKVQPGQTLAVMGVTGSGKSTLTMLLGRFYDVTEGEVLLDGVDIRRYDLAFLRSHLSYIMQETFLFSDTIGTNMKLGAPEATKAEMEAAGVNARVGEFVHRMKDGYETVIGERGIGLSGGQKQRVSIGRALLKQGRILILDDSTSALDVETEYNIQRSLESYEGLTKVIIAHRISAVKNADLILVLEDGKIKERGSHDELVAMEGLYYETCQEQFRGMLYDEEEEAG